MNYYNLYIVNFSLICLSISIDIFVYADNIHINYINLTGGKDDNLFYYINTNIGNTTQKLIIDTSLTNILILCKNVCADSNDNTYNDKNNHVNNITYNTYNMYNALGNNNLLYINLIHY